MAASDEADSSNASDNGVVTAAMNEKVARHMRAEQNEETKTNENEKRKRGYHDGRRGTYDGGYTRGMTNRFRYQLMLHMDETKENAKQVKKGYLTKHNRPNPPLSTIYHIRRIHKKQPGYWQAMAIMCPDTVRNSKESVYEMPLKHNVERYLFPMLYEEHKLRYLDSENKWRAVHCMSAAVNKANKHLKGKHKMTEEKCREQATENSTLLGVPGYALGLGVCL